MSEYIKVDSESDELEHMQLQAILHSYANTQFCSVHNSEGPYKRNLMVQHPCIALVSGAATCA